MTKTIEERLDEQEEVLQLMLTKLQVIENRRIEFPEIRLPDYSNQLEILKRELLRVNHSYPVEKIDEQIIKMKTLHDGIPEVVKVRHHHHFEDKSKGFIIGAIVLLIVFAIAVGLAFRVWHENGRLNDNSVKFRVIRQGYPKVAYWADTLYYHKPEETKQFIEQLEEEQSLAVRMQAIAKEKENAANESVKNLRKLKERLKNTNNGN